MVTTQPPQQRMLALDLLRLVAAAAVWLYHCCYLDPVFHEAPYHVAPTLSSFARYGYLGVPVFFMISGFVIAASARGRSRLGFVRARAIRLYPAFLIALIPTLIALTASGQTISWSQLLANLTMVPRIFKYEYLDGVYWSLMFEILFYAYVASISCLLVAL